MWALQQCRACGGQFGIELKQGELVPVVCNTCLARAEDQVELQQKMVKFDEQERSTLAQIRIGYLSPHE